MQGAHAATRGRRLTLVLLVAFGLAVMGALLIGLNDNPAGGALAYGGAFALILAWAHAWRRPGQFKRLIYASGLGFAGFVVLHNLFDAGAMAVGDGSVLAAVLQACSVVAFLVAVFLCPPGLVVGIGGFVITWVRARGGGRTGRGEES